MSMFNASIDLNHISSGAFLSISVAPYLLNLRAEFGTSHSSTTQRINAFLQIYLSSTDENDTTYFGYGEVGLPPKKKGCYLADYCDIREYVAAFSEELARNPLRLSGEDPFAFLPPQYFTICRASEGVVPSILKELLCRLDRCSANLHEYSNAARCGVEMAILDLWGKRIAQPLCSLFGLFSPINDDSYRRKGFYTVALNSDIEKTLSIIRSEALSSTRYFKIKINHDASFISRLLKALSDEYPATPGIRDWVLDANAAWSPAIAAEFVTVIAPFKDRIYMLEQPFPVDFLSEDMYYSKAELQEWQKLRDIYYQELGILWFADESVSTSDDVLRLLPYVQGCNIKLEKAGGFRGAILAMHTARSEGMKIWSGMMVGSVLAASAPGHLLSLVSEDAGVDLDGSLLVSPTSSLFCGGIQYQSMGDEAYFGYMVWPTEHFRSSAYGLGCQAVRQEPLL